VVVRSEIRAVKWVSKLLPVEMLQLFSNASSCMSTRTRIAIEEHYTVCQHSIAFLF
jgi:hypothetical protein